MRLRVIAMLTVALCLGVGSASAASIGVYFDAQGNTCSATVAPYTPVNFWLLALANGPVAGGISGAEFRMDGLPAGWFVTPTANSPTTLGNPFSGGCNIAFPSCMAPQPPNGMVLLYTCNGFATSLVGPTYLSISRHTTPSNPNFQCPLVTMCDAPAFTSVCVLGAQGVINGGPCTVAVQPSTWSKVKGLYQ